MPSNGARAKAARIAAFYLALIAVWHVAASAGVGGPALPSPLAVARSLAENLGSGAIPEALAHSLWRLALGYGVSMVLGLGLGVLNGSARWADETLGGIALGLQSLPSITWLPMAVLWFGLSNAAIVFVVLMGSAFSIATSARAGIRGLPPVLARAAGTLGASRAQLYRYVILPAMVPAMVQGMKQGWAFAWRALLAGELLFVTAGLGRLLDVGRRREDIAMVIAVMLVIVAVGVAIESLIFGRVEAWIAERWGYVAT